MNKPKKRWLDTQIVVASLAMTFTLFLWNLFSRGGAGSKSGSPTQAPPDDTATPAPTDTPEPPPTTAPASAGVALPSSAVLLPDGQLAPMKILLGGQAPLPSAPAAPAQSKHSGGGGSSSSKPVPPSVTTTHSSHP